MAANKINMSSLSVGEIVKQLSNLYVAAIKAGIPPKEIPAVALWSAPGTGKSDSVRQIAQEIELGTGKKVNITDVRLLLFNPVDLRGIPTANADKTLAVWLKPQIFQMDESKDVVNLLFLDELSAAPQSVQAAAYQIVLDRVVGEHKLPDNCFVLAAGNRVTDKSVAYKMPKALANRLMHFDVVISYDSWREWAIGAGINEKVLGYLSFRNDRLNTFDPQDDSYAFATPRSWEMVSNLLNTTKSEPKDILPLIAGCIGYGNALEFAQWCKIYDGLPITEDIFTGKEKCKLPKQPDRLFAIVSSMTAYAREHKDELDKIENSLSYAMSMDPDFSMLLVKNYFSIEKNYREKLMKLPIFYKYIQGKGAVLNAAD